MRYLTGGESHGPALMGIIEGLPAGLPVEIGFIQQQLARRQGGYGRGGRMAIEKDRVQLLSGVRFGKTLGSPLTMQIENKDWVNWQDVMSTVACASEGLRIVDSPRPGHADLAGGIKYGHRDLRNVLERASARETAMRVAIGAVASLLLQEFQVEITSFVLSIGGIEAKAPESSCAANQLRKKILHSELYCPDREATQKMINAIDQARRDGDTLGGVFEVWVDGLPPGLGSYVHPDRRLDGRLAGALMSIPGIKGVEIGLGFQAALRGGSQVHDAIKVDEARRLYRQTNRAGGLEGGVTNGERLVVRAAMKPIPTLLQALSSVRLGSLEPVKAAVERSDICAVPAASVVGEAAVAWEVARAFCEKFAGDSLQEIQQSFEHYRLKIKRYLENSADAENSN